MCDDLKPHPPAPSPEREGEFVYGKPGVIRNIVYEIIYFNSEKSLIRKPSLSGEGAQSAGEVSCVFI